MEGYLERCTIAIIDGKDDIPESEIRRAIREMNGEKICSGEWVYLCPCWNCIRFISV